MGNVLVYSFSGEVDEIFHLFPSERMARMAAVVRQCGKRVQVIDRANFARLLQAGPEFMKELGSLDFHTSSAAYEAAVREEAAALAARKPDVIFACLWHGTGFKFSVDMLTLLKQRLPDLAVYGFGQKVDEFGEQILGFTGDAFDGLIRGLGYSAVAAIASGAPRGCVPNLIYRKGAAVVTPKEQIVDVDTFPDPTYDPAIYQEIGEKAPIHTLTFSNQACPNRCAFCVRPAVYGRTVRARSVDRVFADLSRQYTENGITHFRVEDSTPPKGALTALARKIVQSELHGKLRICSFSRVDSNSMEDFALLRDAGVIALFFGVESLDDDTLRALKKGTNKEAIIRTMKKAHKAGIHTVGSFIFPTPGATRRSMDLTLEGIAELRPWLDSLLVLPAGVQPNTDWYRHPDAYGIELAEDYVEVAVTYPLKYGVPPRQWKPFPFRYSLMGKPAKDVTFLDIIDAYEAFMKHVRHELELPMVPDFYYLVADRLQQDPATVSARLVECMMARDYAGLRALLM